MAQTQAVAIYKELQKASDKNIENENLLESLPYIDNYSLEIQEEANRLVDEELKRSQKGPGEYLKMLPPAYPPKFGGHLVLQNEYERVRAGRQMEKLTSLQRTLCEEPPPKRRNDHGAWRDAVNNSYSQLEHQYNRLVNLELQLQYSSNVWRAHNAELETVQKDQKLHLDKLNSEIEETNRKRKLSQEQQKNNLDNLSEQWLQQTVKNAAIQIANKKMEIQIKEAQKVQNNQNLQVKNNGMQQQSNQNNIYGNQNIQ